MKNRIIFSIIGLIMFIIGYIIDPKVNVEDSIFGWLGIILYLIVLISYFKSLINFQKQHKNE